MYTVSVSDMRGEQLSKNNESVQDFITDAHNLLKYMGWKYEGNRIRSALYDRTYTKGDRTVTLSGWHGTGKRGTCRWWGNGKSFFSLYYQQKFTMLHKIDCDISHETLAIAEAKQAAAMKQALEFIQGGLVITTAK